MAVSTTHLTTILAYLNGMHQRRMNAFIHQWMESETFNPHSDGWRQSSELIHLERMN
jgi:hypothetical protein